MKQLVQLTKHAEKLAEMNVEVIAVFREEKEGVAGLEKIKEKTKTPFTLCLDTGAEQTAVYSPGRMEFDNYIIGPDGKLAGKIDGNLRRRATSEQLFAILKQLSGGSEEAESAVAK